MTHPTDDELQDLAHSAYEEALSFGLSVDTFLRYFKGIRNRLAQPPVAPPAPGGDVLERRSETGMPMSANAPEKCPITRRPFFMVISHPELGWVPTYGGPYDSYTIPHMEGKPDEPYHERELTCHHYDHDYGGWVDDESIPMRVINEGVLNALQSTQAPCPYEPHPSGICTKCGKAHGDAELMLQAARILRAAGAADVGGLMALHDAAAEARRVLVRGGDVPQDEADRSRQSRAALESALRVALARGDY